MKALAPSVQLLLASILLALAFIRPCRAQEQDEWLAVINGGAQEVQEAPVIREELPTQQQNVRPDVAVPMRRQDVRAGAPLPPPPPPVQRRPVPNSHRRQAHPVKAKPPPSSGVFGGIGDAISGAVNGVVGEVSCATTKLYTEDKLNDDEYMRFQLRCMLGKGRCDELGNLIKRMAPDIIRGACPPPCNACIKGEIQKVMGTVSSKYPREWQRLMRQLG